MVLTLNQAKSGVNITTRALGTPKSAPITVLMNLLYSVDFYIFLSSSTFKIMNTKCQIKMSLTNEGKFAPTV